MAPEKVTCESNLPDDSTTEKKLSWASEVEDDKEATGWNIEPDSPAGTTSLPVYPDGPTKPRKNKKKKKKIINNRLSAKQDSMSAGRLPGEIPQVTPYNDDGWQVASSRKSRQVQSSHTPSPPINHVPSSVTMPPPNNYVMSSHTVPPSTNHFSPSSNFPSLPGRPSPGLVRPPVLRYENANPYGGCNEGCNEGAGKVNTGLVGGYGDAAGYSIKANTGFYSRHGEGVSGYSGKANTGFVGGHIEGDGVGVEYRGVQHAQQYRVPEAYSQRPRSVTDGSGFAPQNLTGSQGSQQGMAVGSSQCKAWGGCTAREEYEKSREENILSKLLPSERTEIEISKASSNSKVEQKITRVLYCPQEPEDLVVTVDSDSACSGGDLDDDSDWIASDTYDSDASVKSLETRKRNKLFQSFFETLEEITNEQIAEHDRQWHCPACQGGVGAIDWYRGLQPLIAHAKTHTTKRIGLHREFAKVLEEDLEMRRAGTGSLSETKFGKWKGLQNEDATKNLMIVWPPMVVIQNTQLELDEQDKWIGMGNKELLDMFKEYCPMKARHAYGPQGHRGMSLVIFGDSPTGYYNAERLAKNFKDVRKGKEHWEQPSRIIFHPGGDRILYGYMAVAEDIEIFNKHSSGKAKLKWDLKRYHEAVAQPMRQMDEENQQLHYYKIKVQKQKEHSKTLEKSMSMFTRKLELRGQEISILRSRAITQHEENQKEIDDLETSYKERIIQLQRNSAKREKEIQEKQEEFKQEHVERCQQLEKELGEEEQQPKQAKVKEEIAQQTQIVESSLREFEDYEYEKRELLKNQHVRTMEFMRKQYEQNLEFERQFERERQELLDKYSKNIS